MIINSKAQAFINDANSRMALSGLKFTTPTASAVQERMMRLGIEARQLDLVDYDEIEAVAIATIKNDWVKYNEV